MCFTGHAFNWLPVGHKLGMINKVEYKPIDHCRFIWKIFKKHWDFNPPVVKSHSSNKLVPSPCRQITLLISYGPLSYRIIINFIIRKYNPLRRHEHGIFIRWSAGQVFPNFWADKVLHKFIKMTCWVLSKIFHSLWIESSTGILPDYSEEKCRIR